MKQPGEALTRSVAAGCSNGDRIRSLWRKITADLTAGKAEAVAMAKLKLDDELTQCSTEATDPWVSQVAKLMATSDVNIDENYCRDRKKAAQGSGKNAEESELNQVLWTDFYNCERVSADNRIYTQHRIVDSTKFQDVRSYGNELARETEALKREYDVQAGVATAGPTPSSDPYALLRQNP